MFSCASCNLSPFAVSVSRDFKRNFLYLRLPRHRPASWLGSLSLSLLLDLAGSRETSARVHRDSYTRAFHAPVLIPAPLPSPISFSFVIPCFPFLLLPCSYYLLGVIELCVVLPPLFLSLLDFSSVISLCFDFSSHRRVLSLRSFHPLLQVLSSTSAAFDLHSVITCALSFILSCSLCSQCSLFFYSCCLFLRHRRRSSIRVQAVYSRVVCVARPSRVMTYFAGRAPPSPAGSSLYRVSLALPCAALCCSLSWSIMQGEQMRGSDKGRPGWRAASIASVIRNGRGKRWRKRRARRRGKKGKGRVLSGFKGRRVGDGGGRPASQPVSSA